MVGGYWNISEDLEKGERERERERDRKKKEIKDDDVINRTDEKLSQLFRVVEHPTVRLAEIRIKNSQFSLISLVTMICSSALPFPAFQPESNRFY